MSEIEIMKLMDKIKYGWMDKNGEKHINDFDTFSDNYVLQSPEDTMKNKVGVCWDQVELERYYFNDYNGTVNTYFIVYYDNEICPTHTFLTFAKNNEYYWFEHSWERFRGIHKYSTLNNLLNDIKNKCIHYELDGKYSADNLVIYEYPKPSYNISVADFYKHCESGKVTNTEEQKMKLNMENFYLEQLSVKRKTEIIDYVNELDFYNSDINGIEIFARNLKDDNFEKVLEQSLNLENGDYAKSIGKAQMKTFLLIRNEDDRVVGALNIRWNFPEKETYFSGNIGYGIRPTERRKGYNKINLYLGLIEAQKIGLNKVKLVCEASNFASVKTIESLGGVLERTEVDPSDGILTSAYNIDVKQSIEKYKNYL